MDGPIHVVGAGGIGCAVGYALARSGFTPILIDANRAKVRWGQSHGLVLEGKPPSRVDFLAWEDWHPSAGAIILLCTKCYDNAAVLDRLPSGCTLIPIQNGFDPALAARADAVEGIASFVSECHPQRPQTRLTRQGVLHLGKRRPGAGAETESLMALLAAAFRKAPFRVRFVDDILPFKYTKLMYNSAISPLAAAAGLDNGQLLSIRPARELFFALLQENYQILNGAGISLARIGPFHPRAVQRILRRPGLANFAARFFRPTLRGTYCSMAGDLPRGQTEIDYYNRHLINLAERNLVPCPLNRAVYDLVKRMEAARSIPALHWLNTLGDLANQAA